MEAYQDILANSIPHRLITQDGRSGEKYLIDETTGRYIKTINNRPMSAGTYGKNYMGMILNRISFAAKGFTVSLISHDEYVELFVDLYEQFRHDK